MAAGKTKGNQSGEKMLAVFEYLIKADEPQKLSEIAEALGMNSSTTLRFLTTLTECGYVRQDTRTLRYAPTLKICALAGRLMREDVLPKRARPYMEQLSRASGESVCLAVREENRIVYVEVLRARNQSLMAVQAVGHSAQMYCNGIGKLFLAVCTEEELEDYIRLEGLKKFTSYTITDKQTLAAELEEVRKQGFALDNQERELGARCIAFPVFGSDGDLIAGVSITGPYSRLSDECMLPRIEEFREIVNGISREMGCGSVEDVPLGRTALSLCARKRRQEATLQNNCKTTLQNSEEKC